MLLQAAEEALRELCGDKLDAAYMGNAPCGFYKYKFPKSVADASGVVGAKVSQLITLLQSSLSV